jgi:hypothetical protein
MAARSAGYPDNRGPRRRVWPAALIITVVAAAVVVAGLKLIPNLHNPFTTQTTDRSQPVLLKSVQDLSRYEAASGQFQVIVDLDTETRFIPSAIRGQRTLFVGAGSVIAYVDFANLKGNAVTVSADRNSASLALPHAQLGPPSMDVRHSYIFAQQQGLFNRIGGFLTGHPPDEQQLYGVAQSKIQAAAQQAGLIPRAEANARTMLTALLTSLGFRQVSITFGQPPAPATSTPQATRTP